MKLVEKIVIAIVALSVLLKLMLISWAWILMLISIYPLGFIYLFFGFGFFNNIKLQNIFNKNSYINISTGRLVGAVGLGFSHFFTMSGILLKLQSLPGQGLCLLIGFTSSIIILIISLIKYKKNKIEFYKNAIVRMFVLIVISCILFFW